ncbi:hypothetical protein JQ608_21270 [Bradyrhizobium liaoningense]|nr:hypothetical protein [Bradyrhizobium liaoningense]
MSDEALRKVFLRQKWQLERRPHSHLCAECQQTERSPEAMPAPPAPVPAPQAIPPNSVYAAWAAANDQERLEFFVQIQGSDDLRDFELWLEVAGLRASQPSPPIEVASPDDAAEDDHAEPAEDAAADWWLEVHGARGDARG